MSRPLQEKDWSIGQELGAGRNCSVHDLRSSSFPGVVVKKGLSEDLRLEGAILRKLHHPSIVQAYGLMAHPEGEEQRCLVLDQLGQSLASLAGQRE